MEETIHYYCKICESEFTLITKYRNDVAFCPYCGFDNEIYEISPCCGAKVDPDTKVCTECKEHVG